MLSGFFLKVEFYIGNSFNSANFSNFADVNKKGIANNLYILKMN